MAELLLVNPSPRRRRKKNPARRHMSALQRKYFSRKRKTNPHRRYARRRTNPSVRRRRRNPSLRGFLTGGTRAGLVTQLKQGFIGAAGGLALDVAMGQITTRLPLPDVLKSGLPLSGLKLVAAMGIGWLGGKVARGYGQPLTQGALTVMLHEVLKGQLANAVPTLPLGEYITFAPSVGYGPGAAPVLGTGLGEYLSANQMSGYANYAGDGVYGDTDVYGGY